MEVLVPLPEAFEDARGKIQPLVDGLVPPFAGPHALGSVLRIVSHAGAVRANHYHRRDFHYCFVERGMVDYYWRPVGSEEPPEHVRAHVGAMFHTAPMTEHAMVFPVETTLYVVSGQSRTQERYEEDVVRLKESLAP